MGQLSAPTPDATTTQKGKVMLAGDLAGTAALPTVVPATTSVAGKIQLAGDLGGAGATPAVVAPGVFENMLMNGGMDVWQRNTTFTTFTDDTYGMDRWNLLSSTTARWTVSRSTDVPSAGVSAHSAKCVLASSTNTQFGMVQILEQKDALKLFGKTVSLSFWAKTSAAAISNLRATVLSWSSTADTVTSDVVGTWAGAGTDPTWAANWTSEKAGSNLALTTSWTEYKVEGIVIDTASTANIAVVIWSDDTTVTNLDEFYITGVMLNAGSYAAKFQPRPFQQELSMCHRFYQHSYPYDTVPGTADGYNQQAVNCTADTTTDAHVSCMFSCPMRITPTCVFYAADAATGSGTAARLRDNTAGGLETISATVITGRSVNDFTTSTAFVVGRSYGCNYTADAEL